MRNYGLLPARLNKPVATWLPRLELVLAVALLLGLAARLAASLVAAMLLVFAVAVTANLARGRRIDCGCFTTPSPRTIGWGLVAGDVVLAAMAATVALADPDVLALLSPGSATTSSLSSEEGLAMAMLAGAFVLGYLVLSSWLSLRSTIRALRAQPEEAAA